MPLLKYSLVVILVITTVFTISAQDRKKAEIMKIQAEEAFNQKNYNQAITAFLEYIAYEKTFSQPDSSKIASAGNLLGQCYEKTGNYFSAISTYDNLINYYLVQKDVKTIKKLINLIAENFTRVTTMNVKLEFKDSLFEKKPVYFRIDRVLNHSGRKYKVIIKGGSNDGILNNSKGIYRGVYVKGADRSEYYGNSEVTEVYPNYSNVILTVNDTNNADNLPRKGDLVSLVVNIPKKHHSIYFDLASINVSFLTNEKDLFFHLRHLVYFDRPELEDAISLAMASDVKETIESLGNEENKDYKVIYDPLKKGLYKGKSAALVMRRSNKNDIMAFMAFVNAFPGKYMGTDYRVDETFATWLINFTPLSPKLIMDSLLTAKDKKKTDYFLNLCREDDISNRFVDNWNEISNDLSDKGFMDSALRVNEFSIKYALFVFDKRQLANAFFNKGELLYDANKYEPSFDYYEKAKKIFLEIGDTVMQARCANNQGLDLIYLNRFLNSIKKFEEALNIKLSILRNNQSIENYELVGNTLWGFGLAYYKMGSYQEARQTYEKAFRYYDTANSSFSVKALIYKKIGLCYNKTGDYRLAIENYEKARLLYNSTAKLDDEADVDDDIAYNYSKSGDYNLSLEFYEYAFKLHLEANNISSAAFSMSNIGQVKWNKGDYPGAIQAHEQSVKLKKSVNDSSGLAYSFSMLGDLYKESGEPLKAKSFLDNALEIYKELNDSSSVANILKKLGDLYYYLQDYSRSMEYYSNALDIREKLKAKQEISDTYFDLAYACFKIKDYSKAIIYQKKSLALRKEIDDKSGQLYSLAHLGSIAQFFEFNYDTAGKYLYEALRLAKVIESKAYYAYSYICLGYLYSSKGDLNNAGHYMDSALVYYRETDDKQGICNTLIDIGNLNISKGNFPAAVDYYNQAMKLAVETSYRKGEATAFLYLGDYYNLIGEYKKALESNNKAIEINNEADNAWGTANAWVSLGNTFNYMGNYQKAMNCYNKSDSIYKSLDDEISRLTPINNIGTIYFYQGDYKNALIKFNTAYQVLDKIKYEGEFMITAKWNLGENYFEDRVYPEAEKWLSEALELAVKSENNRKIPGVSLTLGKLRLAQQKYPEALKLLNTAYEGNVRLGEKERIIEASSFLGKLYFETNQPDLAKKYLEESINLSREIGSTKYLWEPLYMLAQIKSGEKDTATSLKLLTEAVDVIEGLKQNLAGGDYEKRFFSKSGPKVKIYQMLVSELITQNKVKEAFYYQERANVEGLREQTRGNDNTRGADVISEEEDVKDLQIKISGIYEQLVKEKSKPEGQQNKEKINSLEQLMTVAQNDYQNFIDSLVTQNETLAENFSKNVNPIQLEAACRKLPPDMTILEYLIADNKLIIFIASNNTLEAKMVEINSSDFEKFILSFYNQIISKTDEHKLKNNAAQLYSILIDPVKDKIKDSKKLVIIPTGKLFKLPFHAIGKTDSDNKFHYLLEEYSIFYTNNLEFINSAGSTNNDIRIVAYGNADSTLPNAEVEVNNIKSVFSKTMVYTRHMATEDLAKQNMVSFPYIHFATHGNLDPVNFKNSYLTLAPNVIKGEDGRLTMLEIRSIKYLNNCNLVILSACNTAVNDEKIEGWINNPANVFITKGARSVIASLWMVDDLATSKLMENLYLNMKNNQNKLEALRNAQLKLLETPGFTHPYFWAAFELIGDWK